MSGQLQPTTMFEKADIEMLESASITPADPTVYESDPATKAAYDTIRGWDADTRRTEERRLGRRLDCIICVRIVLMYILNYLDRNSIAQARLTGLVAKTGISDADYALINGIFYISYIVGQTPATLLLSRVRPSLFLPIIMVLWAVVSSLTAVCTNYHQLIAVRFILGFCEAPFYPGAVFYLSCWYTRREIGKRVSILVSGICISNAFAGLISAGVINGLSGAHGIEGWQWLFIVEGSMTVGVALILLFIIPDYPATTKSLSVHQRVLAQLRLDQDIGIPDDRSVGILAGLKMAVLDYRTWCFGTVQCSITICIGFNFFFPTLVQGMGFKNKIQILLLTIPPYVLAFLVSYGLSWNADRTQKRVLHYMIAFTITGVALILLTSLASTPYSGAKYFSTFILAAGSFAAYATTYPWLSSLMPRPATKRAAAIAIVNSMSNIGAFVSGYIYIGTFGPTYRVSWAITLGFCVYVACMIGFLGWRARKRNVHLAHVEDRYNDGDITSEQLDGLKPDEFLACKAGFRLAT